MPKATGTSILSLGMMRRGSGEMVPVVVGSIASSEVETELVLGETYAMMGVKMRRLYCKKSKIRTTVAPAIMGAM